MTERTPTEAARDIPEATVARLPVYLRALTSLAESGTPTCSSEELASAAGVNSAKLRKDLSYLGSYGTRGVGYDVEYLRYQIAREIGVTHDWPVVIVGIGNLGHALANFSGFRSRGFRVVALLDADPGRHSEQVAGIDVRPVDQAPSGASEDRGSDDADEPQTYRATGTIERINANSVTLRHGPVPALEWPAMTMPFASEGPEQLRGFARGDRVSFTFVQASTGPRIVSIRKTGQ